MSPADLEILTKALPDLRVWQVANVITSSWKKVYFGAVPYLDAMKSMNDVGEAYGAESGNMVVLYFLSNAQTWRGDVARLVKKELRRRVG